MLSRNIISENTLRRPRTLFTIGILTLCITLFLSYERLKNSAFGPFQDFQDFLEPVDDEQGPVGAVADAERLAYQSILDKLPSASYGTSARPPLKGMPETTVDTLSEHYVPAADSRGEPTKDGAGARRLVIVGDVHGQKRALEDLLEEVRFDNTKGDHLIFTGDLVNKGPDSAGVVALAMELGAHSVRGNHEDRVLLAHAAMTKEPSGAELEATVAAFDKFKINENDGEADPAAALEAHQAAEAALSKGDRRDRETARSLSDEQVRWLARLPIILRIGPVPRGAEAPGFENLVVVHAGLVPNVSLENQDPWAVMNMRTITHPVDELRRDAVREYLVERAKGQVSGNRGALAKLQEVDDAAIDRELEKIAAWQGVRSEDAAPLPSSGRDGTYWYEEWSKYQERLVKKQKKDEKKHKKDEKKHKKNDGQKEQEEDTQRQPVTTIVYGHDAKSGLRVPKEHGKGYTFGLDSGCVYGKQLTALVIETREGEAVYEVVQVDCDKATNVD